MGYTCLLIFICERLFMSNSHTGAKKRSQIRIEKEAAALQRNLAKRKKQQAEREKLKAQKQALKQNEQ